jgi:hypothetical protein
MTTTREELALTIDESEWGWLKPHMERGALILVSDQIDLADAAYRVASDDSITIGDWISKGCLSKPDNEQIKQWDLERSKRFSMIIISPYVLIQERLPTCH